MSFPSTVFTVAECHNLGATAVWADGQTRLGPGLFICSSVDGNHALASRFDDQFVVGWIGVDELNVRFKVIDVFDAPFEANRYGGRMRAMPSLKTSSTPQAPTWALGSSQEVMRRRVAAVPPSLPGSLVVVVGCPHVVFIQAITAAMAGPVTVWVVGGDHTAGRWGTGRSSARAVANATTTVKFTPVVALDWWTAFQAQGLRLADVGVFLMVAATYAEEICCQVSEIRSMVAPGAMFCAYGPVDGSTTLGERPPQLSKAPWVLSGPQISNCSRVPMPAPPTFIRVPGAPSRPVGIVDAGFGVLCYKGLDLAVDNAKQTGTVAEASRRYVKGMGKFRGANGQVVNAYGGQLPDFMGIHEDNWLAWLSPLSSTDISLLLVGCMTGTDLLWLNHHFGPALKHTSTVEASIAWDPVSGADKVCWFKHENVPVGELYTSGSSIALPIVNAESISSGRLFNLIYHDGSHTADDTFLDLELCWRVLSVGGIMIVDDFEYDGTTGDSHEARAVYAGKRGMLCFELLHAGDLEILPWHSSVHTQRAYRKVRATVRLTATPSVPFVDPDRTTLWMGNQPNPDLRPPFPRFSKEFTGATCVDGDWFFDAVETQPELALAVGLARGMSSVAGSLLSAPALLSRNIGGGQEAFGEWIGHGHQDDGIAGLGNAVKGAGWFSGQIGDHLQRGAEWLFRWK